MKYTWLVPEVTQTSSMDCGPACLKSLLQGFNIPVSFGRLREACQTSVDGTSVDTIEELACELGLDAQQVLVPLDHLHLPEAKVTPSIIITQLPNHMTHFVVVWRSFGRWVQVMDPAHGRHWITWDKLKQQVYLHRMTLAKETWQAWANGEDYHLALRQRLSDLGFSGAEADPILATAFQHADASGNVNNWLSIASLDAVISWTDSLVLAKALNKGSEAVKFLQAQYPRALASQQPWGTIIPEQYWWAMADEDNSAELRVKAVVLIRIAGIRKKNDSVPAPEKKLLHARVQQSESSPWLMLYKILLPAQQKLLRWLLPVIVLASATVALQALLFQGLLGANNLLGQQQEFNSFIPMFFAFILFSALMEIPIAHLALALGRQLESQFRIALFNKLPNIHDPYFRSRLLTDMAKRSHKLFVLRLMPGFLLAILQQFSLIIFTLIGILWLDFFAGLVVSAIVSLLLLASIVWQKTLSELTSRAETQSGVINMFYYDSLKGLTAIRSHAAQATFANEQEIQLKRWGSTHYDHQRKQSGALLLLDLLALFAIAALMLSKTISVDAIAPSVLWFYWVLRLPYMVKHLGLLIMDLPQYTITLARYAELLDATEVDAIDRSQRNAEELSTNNHTPMAENNKGKGVAIELDDASLSVAGHQVLNNLNLNITAGQHIAIVGESGAGKSSLCELLLGWQVPTSGQVKVNGQLLEGEVLLQLREQTAWVDANVQLWDRSLLDNLNYDHGNGKVDEAGMGHLLAGLRDGLQTSLGEGGKRLSGGEGQRVRIARALGVEKPQLVILDEPCRGLDRAAREQLLQKLRTTHAEATLICITHDIGEAIKFPHVVVVGKGTIIEQGAPHLLLAQPSSALAHLRNCEQLVLQTLLQDQTWQQLHLVNGKLRQAAIKETALSPAAVLMAVVEEGANV